jgi:hypothetical protein
LAHTLLAYWRGLLVGCGSRLRAFGPGSYSPRLLRGLECRGPRRSGALRGACVLGRGARSQVQDAGDSETDRTRHADDIPSDIPQGLVMEMRGRIESLERQLEQANERDRENRRIIAALTQRIPAIEAPPEAPESPETPPGAAPNTQHPRSQRRPQRCARGGGCSAVRHEEGGSEIPHSRGDQDSDGR